MKSRRISHRRHGRGLWDWRLCLSNEGRQSLSCSSMSGLELSPEQINDFLLIWITHRRERCRPARYSRKAGRGIFSDIKKNSTFGILSLLTPSDPSDACTPSCWGCWVSTQKCLSVPKLFPMSLYARLFRGGRDSRTKTRVTISELPVFVNVFNLHNVILYAYCMLSTHILKWFRNYIISQQLWKYAFCTMFIGEERYLPLFVVQIN